MVRQSLIFMLVFLISLSEVNAQGSFEDDPINYGKQKTNDPIALLQRKLDAGTVKLEFSEEHGYLPSILKALDISTKSQALVFSRTSFQIRKIAPPNPRAIYFDDNTYIGWVQHGDVVEVSSVDPKQGTIFYAMEQEEVKSPKFVRLTGDCLVCHASSRTADVPGSLIRSVFANRGGNPVLGSKTYVVDHKRAFAQRWGGWYVTGTHGKQRHMGNVTVKNKRDLRTFDVEAGANITDLSKFFDVAPYLDKHSDIIALMILEHQGQMQNFITRANFETRKSVWYDKVMNEALERPKDYRSESTGRRINSAAEKLVKYMLFSEEAKLTEQVKGTSGFTEHFAKQGIRDSKGRSLRDFDMKTRMFKYPCSYLIYSKHFDALPKVMQEKVYGMLWDVLSNKNKDKAYAHLSCEDRQAILEILIETKKTLPKSWKEKFKKRTAIPEKKPAK